MSEVLAEYRVGIAKVTLIKDAEGGYRYVVNNAVMDDIKGELRDNLEMIILGSEGEDSYSLLKSALKIFRMKRRNVSEAKIAYAFREETKYRKLQVLIDDPYVEDISIVGPGVVWVRHSFIISKDPSADYIRTNIVIKDNLEFLEYMNLLSERAGKVVSKANPIVDVNLPEEDGGHRLHLVHPDIADGKGEIVIRKKKSSNMIRLNELVRSGTLSNDIVKLIKHVIMRRGSILIVGPPGSGKTTLLRAILYDLIPKEWKVAIIEDTPEIDPLPGSCWVRYVTPLNTSSTSYLNQMLLTKAALRSSISRFIIIGETRGAEARVLVQAMNMGLGGLTTFHGGSASEAITRLTAPPINLTPQQVAMFNIIITISYVVNGGLKRAVTSIDEPIYDSGEGRLYLNRIYEYGEEADFRTLMERLRKVKSGEDNITALNEVYSLEYS